MLFLTLIFFFLEILFSWKSITKKMLSIKFIYLLGAYDKAIKLKINHNKGVIGLLMRGERYYFNQIMEELIKKENKTKGDYDRIYYSLLDLSNNRTYCGTIPANYSRMWEKNV